MKWLHYMSFINELFSSSSSSSSFTYYYILWDLLVRLQFVQLLNYTSAKTNGLSTFLWIYSYKRINYRRAALEFLQSLLDIELLL